MIRCEPCFARDRIRPATNLEQLREYPQATPRCDNCEEAAGMAQWARDFAAYHGASVWPFGERA